MKRVIEIDILKKDDLYQQYNHKIVSDSLIEYLVKSANRFNSNDEFEIIINKRIKDSCSEILKEGLTKGYQKSILTHYRDNYLQIVYFLIGFIMLFFSRIINENLIIDEILIIGGWVLIWESISIELFNEVENRKRRKIMKNLANSTIIENYIK